jgi:DNA-binding GntR family transcriptional regulator
MVPREPLYARIEAKLRESIATGRHPVGSLLPTEAELCASLGVSRHTVREALRRLVEAGLVERRQGAGSVVVQRETPRMQVQSIRDLGALLQYAADTRLQVTRRAMLPLDADRAAIVQAEPGEAWLRIDALRLAADGRPIGLTEVLIHPRFAVLPETLPSHRAIYTLIEEHFGIRIGEVVQEVTAAPLPREVAQSLNCRPKEVGMRFLRRYHCDAGHLLMISRSWHPAQHFTYVTRIRREED